MEVAIDNKETRFTIEHTAVNKDHYHGNITVNGAKKIVEGNILVDRLVADAVTPLGSMTIQQLSPAQLTNMAYPGQIAYSNDIQTLKRVQEFKEGSLAAITVSFEAILAKIMEELNSNTL